jgi:hypothetical protein
MEKPRSLRSATRETTPEYNVQKISKNNGRIAKTLSKPTLANRFSPTATNKPPHPKNDTPSSTTLHPKIPPTIELDPDTNMSDTSFTVSELSPLPEETSHITTISREQSPPPETSTTDPFLMETFSDASEPTLRFSTEDKGKNPTIDIRSINNPHATHFTNTQSNTFTPTKNTHLFSNLDLTSKNRNLIKTAINPEFIPGITDREKILFIKNKLASPNPPLHIRTETPIGDKLIVAVFNNLPDAENACKIQITDDPTQKFLILPNNNTNTATTRTIRMWDIPTHFTKKEIHEMTSPFGPIETITLSHRDPWLSATITFSNTPDYEKAIENWSLTKQDSSMRIFPFLKTRETKELRNTYRATLINLPTNTSVQNLSEIITITKAKTCYIPKDIEGNNKKLAILTFENQTDLTAAKQTSPTINNTLLEWTDHTMKLCPKCSSKNHHINSCPEKYQTSQSGPLRRYPHKQFNNFNQFQSPLNYSHFNSHTPRSFKSYADSVKNTPPSNHNFDSLFQMFNQLKTTIDDIKNHMFTLEERISLIEQDIVERHIETEIDEMEEDTNSSTTSTETTITPSPMNQNQDIRESQTQLNDKLEKIGETMSQMFNFFNSTQQSIPATLSLSPNPLSNDKQ